MNHESYGDFNFNCRAQYSYQRIGTRNGEYESKKTSRNYSDDFIVESGQNTKKSPEDVRENAITQIPVQTITE